MGIEHGENRLKNEDIKVLMTLHETDADPRIGLSPSQIRIIHGAIDLYKRIVKYHMIPLDKSCCLSSQLILTRKEIKNILRHGYSRIPIYKDDNPYEIVGILITKRLLGVKLDTPISENRFLMKQPIKVDAHDSMVDLLSLFLAGRSHMALIIENTIPIGLITLEDIMESILKEDILDEEDHDTIIREIQDKFTSSRDQKGQLLRKMRTGQRKLSATHKRIKSFS